MSDTNLKEMFQRSFDLSFCSLALTARSVWHCKESASAAFCPVLGVEFRDNGQEMEI